MDFELKAAKAKWEREQREKIEQARARVERERRVKEEAARQRQALEEAQRLRRIEAAQAELEAREREQEELELGDGILYNRVLRASRIPRSGDKVTLPARDFEVLQSQGALDKGPMFFRISPEHGSSTNFTHGGVLEFTSADGCVGLPPHIWRNAGLDPSSEQETNVRIRYVRLPKGRYAKLQPVGLDFGDVPNHKAVLEGVLRLHAAISEGDILFVPYGGMEYHLRVLELNPAPAVSVLETDIEVDVVSTLADEKAGTSEKLVQLALGKGEAGEVEQGGYKYFKFHVDHHLAEALGRGEVEVVIRLQVDGDGVSDADIYAAAHPVIFPSREEHQWASHSIGSKVVSLSALLPGLYSVAVHGFRGTSRFVLSVEARPVEEKSSGHKLGGVSGQGQVQDGYETCGNCKQMIPARTYTLHEVYCRRHNVPCLYPGCGVVMRREEAGNHIHCRSCGVALTPSEEEKHMSVFHAVHTCSCGARMEMQAMVQHKAHDCPHRRITCRFCGDVVEAGGPAPDIRDHLRGLSQHESRCGSRTDQCSVCNRAVMLKEMDLHLAAVHAGPTTIPHHHHQQQQVDPVPTIPHHHQQQQRQQQVDPVPASAPAAPRPPPPAPEVEDMTTECPLCGGEFAGVDAFNLHFDRVHLDDPPRSAVEPGLGSNFRQSLSVQCPICGMAVHSERDLSSHIDMVH